MGAVGQGLLDVGGLGGPETSSRLVGMACCQRPASTSPARLSAMVGGRQQGDMAGGTRDKVRGSPPSGSNTSVPVSAMAPRSG